MRHTAVRVAGLRKQYRIGDREPYGTIRESLTRACSRLLRRDVAIGQSAHAIMWALDDVSFEIGQGEILGIIGRNGAGKTTLLKILSRITEPTAGVAEVRGRVGSLLEIGTGFHPELTGGENVYLNGAILGMTKAEIERKFEAIVAFAEVNRFIDTPVKRYSSGMYVRLAFSVAAHLEPQILLLDEVLAVGDLAFQQKCLTRIRALTASGMTILFVSHNMAAIQSACDRVLYLDAGRVVGLGRPGDVVDQYRDAMLGTAPGGSAFVAAESYGSADDVAIMGFQILGSDGARRREIGFDEAVQIRIELDARRRIETPLINFGLRRGDGVIVCNFNNWYDDFRIDCIDGRCVVEGWLPPLRLVPDYYEIHVLVWRWGGGHIPGDVTRMAPLAARTFGDVRVRGPALNSHDGVFQIPARKWRFTGAGHTTEYVVPAAHSIESAFVEGEGAP